MRKRTSVAVLSWALVAGTLHAQDLRYFGYDYFTVTPAELNQTSLYTNVAVTNPDCQGSTPSNFVCGSCQSIPPVVDTVNAMSARGVKAIVDLSQVLFCADATSGRWTLRPDYVASWQAFRRANRSVLDSDHVASVYIMDEPTLHGVTSSELASATTLIKNNLPAIPASMVEAYLAVDRLIIPSNMDWIGIDEYAVGDPATDLTYQRDLQVLKSKLSQTQKIIYVMDAFFDPNLHGTGMDGKGWTPSQLSCVASRWYNLAVADPSAALLVAFIWDGPNGSQSLPQSVRDLQAAAGSAITGKSLPSQPTYNCAPSYQGYHDGDGCGAISGWAWDSNPLNPPISVDLYADGSLLAAQVPANLFRQDLLNAGIGNGFHAWVYDYKTKSPSLADGQPHLIRAKIANTQTDLSWTPRWFTCGGSHAPYHGSPSPIPGSIQAEDFDTGGEGVAYHDTEAANLGGQYRPAEGVDIAACSDGAGCYTVGWTQPGEWLLYTISVPTAGTYSLQVRVASAGAGGTFHVELNGTDKTGPLTVPDTGGWDTWQTVTKSVTLDAGWQAMKLVMDGNGATGYVGNFNYLQF